MNLVDEATSLLTFQNRNLQCEIEELCRRQQRLMNEAEQSWYRFLPWFKKQCREFCDGVDSGFEPLLQKLLLNEDWTFPKWEEVFYVKQEHLEGRSLYSPPYYQSPVDFWSIQIHRYKNHQDKTIAVLSKIKILAEPEKHTRDFLNRMYALYQKLPRGREGLFDVEVTWEDLYEYIFEAMQIVYHSGGDFRLFLNLNWKTMQRIYHAPVVFKNKTYVFPARELEKNNLYFIKDTPFEVCIPKRIKVAFPLKSRLEHQWIVAGSGAGKTQLLQRMICADIEHGRSVIVIDSQRDMIGKLIRLKHDMEVVYIDPEDIEYPPGIALFDVKFGSGAEAEARETQVIELYEYMFSVFGAELTARQGSLFTYGLRLMFAIPKANIHTLVDLFRGDKYQFKRYWEKMDSVERDFFEKEFFEKKYAANREQILAKLNKILENKTLRRIFSNTESKLDFGTLLNRPVAVFINTSQEQLGENGCALFGRFLLSLITNAIVGRSKMPEDQRRSVFIYVDEGRDYGNDDAFERIIYQCRKYKAGLIFCSQNIGQLSQKTVSALFTSSIKFVRAVKEPQETRKLAQSIRVEEDFLHDLDIKDRSHAEWACKIENQKTVKVTVNFGYLENCPKISEAEYQKLREENRRKYCVKASENSDKTRVKPEEKTEEERDKKIEKAKLQEIPKREKKIEEPSARQIPKTPDPHDFLE